MSTALKNKVVREVAPNAIFEDASDVITSALTCAQGDLLCLIAGVVALAVAETDGATFLGASRQKLVSGQPQSPYQGTAVDAAQAAPRLPGPQYGIESLCVAKTGDAFAPGVEVYLDPATGSRGVQAAGTKVIGVYVGPTIASASAGQEITVRLGSRYPGDTLKM